MHNPPTEHYVGLLTFLSFAFSVFAAVIAVDMYALLRTGEFGSSWRVLIISWVIFAFTQGLKLGELLDLRGFGLDQLAQIGELIFVMAIAYAFYLQRQVFDRSAKLRRRSSDKETDVAAMSLRRSLDLKNADANPGGIALEPVEMDESSTEMRPLLSGDEEDGDDSDIEWSRPVASARER